LSHLKAAPIHDVGWRLLLVATGLLFLLSKAESAVPSHFRQPTFSQAPTVRRLL